MIAWPLCRASKIIRRDSDSDVEEDQRTSNEFMADLNAEYHERALLANQKRFYKRFDRVGSARKPLDKTKETCFAYGNLVIFKRTIPHTKLLHHLIPSSKVNFRCKDNIIGFNNAVALLDHPNESFRPMLSFLSNCCINRALTLQPSAMYVEYLKEF
ncbi:hypothetical protein Tco_1582063 [Tanacetum coccineum]